MGQNQVRKTEYVGLFIEPDRRAAIEGEARRSNLQVRSFTPAILRDQVAILIPAVLTADRLHGLSQPLIPPTDEIADGWRRLSRHAAPYDRR